ncbi:uncharacterized protein LOC132735477 [Ruditapes philippinarum]|uniref:uncharacterized protein LOC132735477 n=1 Tax=Ruditapes philippinarum TaxID=129788 RepID=UPI00295B4891|nr:uncharacterized protein LOC132735477 [Ruditapes philippinarum]
MDKAIRIVILLKSYMQRNNAFFRLTKYFLYYLFTLFSANAFESARALEILAILATTAAIVVVCLKIFFKKENNRLLYIATPIPLFASLFVITGVIMFVVDNEAKKFAESTRPLLHFKPHASFGLSIVAGILNIVASPMLILAARAIPGLR